jgi:hypothetical protein
MLFVIIILKRDIIENDVVYKKSYDAFHWPQKVSPSLLSLSHTPSLSLIEIMRNHILDKIVSSIIKNFNAT